MIHYGYVLWSLWVCLVSFLFLIGQLFVLLFLHIIVEQWRNAHSSTQSFIFVGHYTYWHVPCIVDYLCRVSYSSFVDFVAFAQENSINQIADV